MKHKKCLSAGASLLLTLFLLSACAPKSPPASTQGGWSSTDIYTLQGTHSATGYYYLNDLSILCYFDEASKKNVILCNKAGCTHESKTCPGYSTAQPAFLFFTKDKLLSIEQTSSGWALLQRDEDGSNLEQKLLLMKDSLKDNVSANITDYRVYGNTLYYLSIITLPQSGEAEQTFRYYRVDLTNMQEKVVYESKISAGTLVAANEHQLIFHEYDAPEQTASNEEFDPEIYYSNDFLSKNIIKLQLWNDTEETVRTLFTGNRWEYLGGAFAYGEQLYVIDWDSEHKNNGILSLNINTGAQKRILEPTAPINNFCPLNSEEILLARNHIWKQYQGENLQENNLPFMTENDRIVQATENGYIVIRVLEKEQAGENSFHITKQAYSYLSKEESKKEDPAYIDFYIP